MPNRSGQWFIPVLLAVGAGVLLWYYWQRVSAPDQQVASPPAVVSEPEPADIGPLHPVESRDEPHEKPADLVPLPSLDQSDAYFRLGVLEVFGSDLDAALAQSGMIQRIVATVDNLPRSRVPERIRPVGNLGDSFRVDPGDESGAFRIDSSNYERYEPLLEIALAADLGQITDMYRRFYPLFQRAYEDLGYPNAYFNDRLVEVIDHLLATPEPGDSLSLVRPHVLYEYENPELEALSGGQKLLLRMGADNAGRVKGRLRELRDRITRL